jgi:hypothetical protein
MQLVKISLLLMMLHINFERKPCPSEWSAILESICNLATAILHSNNWDPKEKYAPNHHLVPNKTTLDDDILFDQGKELIVNISIDSVEHMTSTSTTSSA